MEAMKGVRDNVCKVFGRKCRIHLCHISFMWGVCTQLSLHTERNIASLVSHSIPYNGDIERRDSERLACWALSCTLRLIDMRYIHHHVLARRRPFLGIATVVSLVASDARKHPILSGAL